MVIKDFTRDAKGVCHFPLGNVSSFEDFFADNLDEPAMWLAEGEQLEGTHGLLRSRFELGVRNMYFMNAAINDYVWVINRKNTIVNENDQTLLQYPQYSVP